MSINLYPEGALVTVSAVFTTSGTPVDPTGVFLSFGIQGATPTLWTFGGTGSIVKDSVGNYHADLDTSNLPGMWVYSWWSTGSGQAAQVDQNFQVQPSQVR